MTSHGVGLDGGGFNPATTPAYDIYLLGQNDPIKRRFNETGHETEDQLLLERELLPDAWRSMELLELPKGEKGG